jgi:hypothetical protein
VCRRGVQRQRHCRWSQRWNVADHTQGGKSCGCMWTGARDRDAFQPHDSSITVRDFGAVVIVDAEVAVANSGRMSAVCFVHMLRQDHSRQSKPRHQGQRSNLAPQRLHAGRIMVSLPGPVNLTRTTDDAI